MTKKFIDYAELVDEAMHIIVKKSLNILASDPMIEDHHFFISFLTSYPGVEISQALRHKYPDEMTIVLQYQFEKLTVEEDIFSVLLSFNGVKEKLVIPFKSLTAFADPSVKFGLQFKQYILEEDDDSPQNVETDNKIDETEQLPSTIFKNRKANNVITLDNFRKNKK